MVRFTGGRNDRLPPGSWCLICLICSWCLSHCGRNPALSSSSTEGPGSRNSVPFLLSMPKLSPVQSLSPSSLHSLGSQLCSSWCCINVPRFTPGACAWAQLTWLLQRECANEQVNECMLLRNGSS